jgi:FkbM family methyltransferase
MYYLKEQSLHSETPIFQKLESTNTYLFPEFVIARDFASRGIYEKDIIEWARQFVRSDQVFVDVGAHVGTYALSFAPHVREVYAFECSPRTFNVLCGNIALRELDYKIKPFHSALGNTTGHIDYYIRSVDGGGSGVVKFKNDDSNASIKVPLAKLDSFDIENIGLIKIDVEGFEKQVLEGAVETLRRNNYPKLLFESWSPSKEGNIPATKLRNDLFEYIESIGYKIVPIRGYDEMFLAEFNK